MYLKLAQRRFLIEQTLLLGKKFPPPPLLPRPARFPPARQSASIVDRQSPDDSAVTQCTVDESTYTGRTRTPAAGDENPFGNIESYAATLFR